MRLLLNECVDRRLARELTGHDIATVPQRGWAGIKNGQLLALAQREFDAFITVDRKLAEQQDLARYGIAVVLLRARSNRLAELRPLAAEVLQKLPAATRGTLTIISASDSHAPN